MIPVSYGYARISKTDAATRNLETRLHIPQEYGIREEHIFADEVTGSSMSRPAWNELMTRVRPKDSAVIAWRGRSTGTSTMEQRSRRTSASKISASWPSG